MFDVMVKAWKAGGACRKARKAPRRRAARHVRLPHVTGIFFARYRKDRVVIIIEYADRLVILYILW